MDAGTQTESGKGPRGRKDSQGQEKSINLAELKARMGNLLALHKKSRLANDALSDAVKASAEAAGLLTSEVAAFVKASSGDSEAYEASKLKAKQRALIFDELESSTGQVKQ